LAAAVTSRPALRSLAAIMDLPVRVGAVARRAEARPEAFVAELASLVVSASLGSPADAEAVLACALWLIDRGASGVPELRGARASRPRAGTVRSPSAACSMTPRRASAT